MNVRKRIAAALLGALLLLPPTAAAGVKRPRPSDVSAAETAIAPNGFQVYNDYASPERVYSSAHAVVHYVVLGIDAPPLNDDDADGIPDYVERVGDAADRALAYYERRGFHAPLQDTGGPDARPDVYVSRFSPGTLGVSFPAAAAQGGAFAVVSNNLDPSAGRSFASVYATVAHELFHIVQFSYFDPDDEPAIPTWILEGTAAALEARVNPELDDVVSTIQMRRWFAAPERSITTQSYGAQLLWRQLDTAQPRFLPALLARLAARPVADEGEPAVASTYRRVTGKPFANAFHGYAVSMAIEHEADIDRTSAPKRAVLAPLSVRYVRGSGGRRLTVSFTQRRGAAAATLVSRVDSDVPGNPPRVRLIAPRVGDGGHTLTFEVPATRRATAVLVISNGGERPVRYAVSVR